MRSKKLYLFKAVGIIGFFVMMEITQFIRLFGVKYVKNHRCSLLFAYFRFIRVGFLTKKFDPDV